MAGDGRPLTDLTAADFEVREGGRSHPVTSATIATSPIRVAIIVADVRVKRNGVRVQAPSRVPAE